MEEDDDFYGAGGAEAQAELTPQLVGAEAKLLQQKMNVSDNDDDDEEEDSEDDIQIVLEKPDGVKTEPSISVRPSLRPTPSQDRPTATDPKPAKTAKHSSRPASTGPAPATTAKSALTHNGKEGSAFPEVRTSKLDLDTTPSFPLPNGTNKPISGIDLDADLAEHTKPWRLPGTDQTDFFNYGFDEYTWTQYCIRQQTLSGTIGELKASDAQMKAMFGAGGDGAGGMPPMPGMGGGGMPGMPDPQQMMQQMMQSGMDPGKMDFGQFMAMMGGPPSGMSGMGSGGPPGPGQGQQGGGFASPVPQQGQGFQPPSGPAGGQAGPGQQGGFGGGVNMEGFSPQQIAIMQQEQMGGGQGGVGGGGGRGRGRRGRGFY